LILIAASLPETNLQNPTSSLHMRAGTISCAAVNIGMRDALRSLTSTPGPAVAAVLTLALAIGMNAGMVGLVDRALLGPPRQVRDPSRVVSLAIERGEVRMSSTSYVTYKEARDNVTSFAAVAAWQPTSTTITVNGEQIRADAMLVSGNYFDLLGVAARMGRQLQSADDVAAADPVIVLGHAFWRAAFGADPGVLGRRVSVGGLDYVVSGIMPPGFSGHSSANVDLWMPFAAAMRKSPGWDQQPYMNVASIVARLGPGVTLAAASAQATAVLGKPIVLATLAGAEVSQADRRVAFWLTGVSALVLAIGVANASTLLLVRASRRRREFAIRAALGAARGRLIRHAFMEAALLSGVAVGLSLLLAVWFDGAVRQVLLPGVAPAGSTGTAAALAALAAGLVAAVATGLANASNLPRALTAGNLAETPGSTRAGAGGRLQRALLVLQTSLSVVLLAGAGMFGRSLSNLLAQDLGMRMDGVFVVDFEEGAGGGRDGREDVFGDALARVRALPGVRAATAIGAIPFGGHHVPPIAIPGRAEPPNVGGQLPFLQAATPEFFDILGVQIVDGRALTAADDRGAPVVVVNETMARTVWPGEPAIGKCIRIGFDPGFDPETAQGPPTPSAAVPCRQIVGVARDMRQRSLVPEASEARLMQYFVPFAQVPVPPFIPNPDRGAWGLLMRADASAAALGPAVRRVVVGTRTDLPYVRVRPYAQLLERQLRPWRLGTTLFALFGALAVTVGATGLYAAFAHAVTLRRREMAIRLAIGARPRGVVMLVLREALAIAAAGIVCGWLGVLAGGRSLQALLYDTSAADPSILAGAAALMIVVATAATLLPARAASRTDPASLLR
jgi:putative ABC transport system permease protein